MKKLLKALTVLSIIFIMLAMVGCEDSRFFEGSYSPSYSNTNHNNGSYSDESNSEPIKNPDKTIILSMDFQGGSTSSAKTIVIPAYQTTIQLPRPLKNGHTFEGFFTAPNQKGFQASTSDAICQKTILDQLVSSNGTITLYAGFSPMSMEVTLIDIDGDRYYHCVNYGEYLTEYKIGTNQKITAFSQNQSGNPVFNKPITSNMTLYAVEKTTLFALNEVSCKHDNGFNPSVSGTIHNIQLTSGWNLLEAILTERKTNSGKTEYRLGFKVLQDITDMPRGTLTYDQAMDVWLANDSFSGRVCTTNIVNQQISYGAGYIEVKLGNSENFEFSKTNLLSSAQQYDTVQFYTFETEIPVESIRLVVVYELALNNPKSHFLGFTWSQDYRAELMIYP